MFTPKAKVGEAEFKNAFLVHDPCFDRGTPEQREAIRTADLEKGHVWLSFDPAETSVGCRMERRYKDRVVGMKTLRFSIYTHVFAYYKTLPDYAVLDEAICHKCGKQAKYTLEGNTWCGTHCGAKYKDREEIKKGRAADPRDKSRFHVMEPYHNIVRFLRGLDLREVRYVVVEQQMAINYRTTRMCQHLLSTLMAMLAESPFCPLIYEVNAKVKSKVYGVSLKRPELKRWTMRKAIWNAAHRGEAEFLRLFVQESSVQVLIDRCREKKLSEEELWLLVEPDRNMVVKAEKDKARKKTILCRSMHQLFDMSDATEQIESTILELGLPYFTADKNF